MVAQGSRIALLLDHLESDYHFEIVAGVRRIAARYGARLIVVAGGAIGTASRPVERNFIYDDLANARLDGLIVLSGCLSNSEGTQELEKFMGHYRHLPAVVIGVAVGGLPGVTVDNSAGVRSAVSHLIEAHGSRRLAFICGPTSSSESRDRLEGFRQALEAHGIELTEKHIVPGGLSREDGINGVELLFEHRGARGTGVDAVVCVNDEVALGVLEELHRRNIAVPKPVAVTGFDDEPGAQSSNPPLTTVRQSARAQGETAAVALLEYLTNGQPIQDQLVDSELILRDTCGCRSRFTNDSRLLDPDKPRVARSARLALIERRSVMVLKLSRAAGGRMAGVHDWEGRLIDALSAQVDSEEGGAFHWEFERLARQHVLHGGDPMVCHDVLTELRLQALVCAEVRPDRRPRLEDDFQEARLLLARVAYAVGREHQDGVTNRMRLVRRVCLEQVGRERPDILATVLDEQLPLLGISSYCISRVAQDESGKPQWSVVAARNSGLRSEAVEVLGMKSLGLTDSLERLSATVVEPLTFAGRPVGVASFAWGAVEPRIYEELREALSMAVYVAQSTPPSHEG